MSSVGGTGGKSSNKRKRKSGDHSIFSETTRGGGTDTNHHHHHQTTAGKTKNETSTSNTINGSSATIVENDNTNNNNNKKQQQQQIDTMDSSTMVLLTGHEKEVFRCVWNPTKNVVATGSSDATARIWEIPTDFFTYSTTHEKPTTLIIPKVLVHGIGEDRDVTTIDWNVSKTYYSISLHILIVTVYQLSYLYDSMMVHC
jgi:WD40 repeat protein